MERRLERALASRVGCSFQGNLSPISKLLCHVFVIYYLSSRTALENCVLFVISLRSSWENFFGDTRVVLLTQAINLSGLARGQCGLHGKSFRFRKHSPSLPKRVSVIGLYCYHVNRMYVLVLCSHFEQLRIQSNCWTYLYWSCLLTTWQY